MKTFEFTEQEAELLRKEQYKYLINDNIDHFLLLVQQIVSERITTEPGESIKPYHEHGNSVASDRTKSGQSAEEKDKWNGYEYANQLATLIHARCYPELPQWEPLPDLIGLLTQIDNMVCGLERKADAAQSKDEWDIVEGILGRCNCAEIYTSRRMADPNCAWCEYHVDLIQSMRLHASQVCAGKDEIIKERELEILSLTYDKDKEIDRLNESLTVIVRKNAELEKEVKEAYDKGVSVGRRDI